VERLESNTCYRWALKEPNIMPSTHTNLHYHFVFSTKDRIRLIRPEWKERLHAYMGGIMKNLDCVPLAVGGTSDHVHLLVGLKPTHRIDYIIRDIKADSSVLVKTEFENKFTWQKGYGAFTVSPTGVDAVRRYVLNQEDHHNRKTFQEEYVELLNMSKTPYDEKYLW